MLVLKKARITSHTCTWVNCFWEANGIDSTPIVMASARGIIKNIGPC